MPKGLCRVCPIGPIVTAPTGGQQTGDFVDCTATYDLTSNPKCIDKLQKYVNRNPCDTARAEALDDYLNSGDPEVVENARQILDYFVYSVCEQGCDCIPQENADRSNPTFEVRRGNCQAHAFYDICRILPDIKLIKLVGTGTGNLAELPEACPLIRNWFNSPASQQWSSNPMTTVEPDVEYFLNRTIEAVQLTKNKVWNDCFDLELTQGRIDE
eukprot:CAMPEP_0198330940 /NCGR_PEP_ID=MMETSP1450-20131203/17247_1 /TAXON_ID=753684 ORGANISM="Madagascaria erythrocladiodes, Strain CCMP3234" /NCGR_SAMPLE_ID=MMETSP1450 /ASSEMBLY_ACC=CAM_ASM_001115 /LENGTH=212 /DNA_ID=CAMNT_0044035275 /DNA_START=269 /DNA_END=907 /DNA_ORIENTATION=-